MAKIQTYGSLYSFPKMMRLYVNCKSKMLGIYSLGDAAGDEGINLEEPNPDSVGEVMVETFCAGPSDQKG